jgi:hypothetical protein
MKKKNNSEDWVTQKEAAEKSGRSLASINNLVKRERIASKEIYGKVLVSLSEVLGYSVSAGRPLKPKSSGVDGHVTAQPSKKGSKR